MKAAVEQARAQGESALPPPSVAPSALALTTYWPTGSPPIPAAERPPGQRGRLKQSPARNLLERLLLRKEEVLAFLPDFAVPFDNNQAEQDLRMLKVQQKIAGSFRADSGAEAVTRIRGYCASLRKQGAALLATLQTVWIGQPLYPALD